jgi:molybdate transport system substrate-binding protein
MQRRILITALAALATAAIEATAYSSAAQAGEVVVFAAASLKNALDDIAAKWQHDTGKRTVISYGASPGLAKQIEAAAPADIFISADLAWMDYLQERKLIDPKTRVDLLGNILVLIASRDSTAQVTIAPGFPLAALLGDGRLAVCDPDSVPAGRYGKAALATLGVWSAVATRLAVADNVRAALLLVARGEAPLGIVYQTDAAVEPAVKILGTFPSDSHPPIIYPVALTAAATNPDANAFALYLSSPAARPLFEAQGFTVLDPAR